MGEYGRSIVVNISFERAVAETTKAIRAGGCDPVSAIDLRDYLTKHAHFDCRRYMLFSVLLPELALDVVQHDPELGPIVLATVAIYELPDGQTTVAASASLSPIVFEFGWRAERPAIAAIADRAGERLGRALDRVQRSAFRSATQVRT